MWKKKRQKCAKFSKVRQRSIFLLIFQHTAPEENFLLFLAPSKEGGPAPSQHLTPPPGGKFAPHPGLPLAVLLQLGGGPVGGVQHLEVSGHLLQAALGVAGARLRVRHPQRRVGRGPVPRSGGGQVPIALAKSNSSTENCGQSNSSTTKFCVPAQVAGINVGFRWKYPCVVDETLCGGLVLSHPSSLKSTFFWPTKPTKPVPG